MKTLNIKGKEWLIEYKPELLEQDKEGECDQENKTIYYARWEPTTIFHELIHAYLWECGLRGECDWGKNETIVDWFANTIQELVDSKNDILAYSQKDNTQLYDKYTVHVEEENNNDQ